MKRILTLIMVLALCASLVTLTVAAANNGTMTVSSVTAAPGETGVSVIVKITSNPGFASMIITPTYDSSVLTLKGVYAAGSYNFMVSGDGVPAAVIAGAVDTTATGNLVKLVFDVKATKETTTNVGVKIEAGNANEEDVIFNVSGGTVKIVCDHAWSAWTGTQATCGKAGNLTRTCSACGATESMQPEATGEHTYGTPVVKDPTCVADGSKTSTCSVCGDKKVETIPATGKHTYGDWTKADDKQHEHICSVCQKSEKADHAWDDGKVTTEPTCSAEGVKTYTCSDCGATKTEAVAATGDHKYDNYTYVDEDVHVGTCACGETHEDEHVWDSGKVTVKPTPEADGIRTYTCAVCGGTKAEVEEYVDNVPNTGDITPHITMGAVVVLAVLMGTVALVSKRKAVK